MSGLGVSPDVEWAFGRAVSLRPGEWVRIPCASLEEARRTRHQFLRYRQNAVKAMQASGVLDVNMADPWSGLITHIEGDTLTIQRPRPIRAITIGGVDPDRTETPPRT